MHFKYLISYPNKKIHSCALGNPGTRGNPIVPFQQLIVKCIFNTRDHGYSTSELRKRVFEAEKEKLTT